MYAVFFRMECNLSRFGRVKFTLNQEIWGSSDRAFRIYSRGRVGSVGISFRLVSRCIFQRLSHSLFRNMLWANVLLFSSLVLLHSLWPVPSSLITPFYHSLSLSFSLSLSLSLSLIPWNLFNAHDIGSSAMKAASEFFSLAQSTKSNSQRMR